MRLFIYNLVLALAAAPFGWWLRRHPKYHPLAARFHAPATVYAVRPLWIQACSLGEVNTVRPLVKALRTRYPDRPVVVTSSTLSGHARAVELYGRECVTWFPFDTRRAVKRFVDALNPEALVLVETELWPNVIAYCRQRAIPVLIVNGRLSEKHLRRYTRLRFLFGPVVSDIARAGMQSAAHAARIEGLGALSSAVRVTGNMKFDAVQDQVPARERQRARFENGFKLHAPVLCFSSTRIGDEALASACWATLREEYPELRLVVAPRHPERADEVAALFSEPVLRRSAVRAGAKPRGERVFLLDTLGEMGAFLALASVVVVGGSFYPGVNGHNPLEPAALGIPTLFGPYMGNFAEAAEILVARGGAQQVPCPEDLYLALSRLLGDSGEQRQMGTRARKAVLDNQGAVRNNVALIEEVLPSETPTRA